MPVRRIALVSVMAAAALGCSPPGAPRESDIYESLGPRYEAREWLSSNPSEWCLASNRFSSRAEASDFVEGLYEAGAETVWVLNVTMDSATIALEGGPYADALLVRLPREGNLRMAILAIAGDEAEREGFEPEDDTGQDYTYLWWD
jgi:hypothetical protein